MIYLAGPITGCTFEGCTDWREQVKDALLGRIDCLSPMRGKDYLKSKEMIHHDYPEHILSCQRGIMARDFFDCQRCELVLANLLGADRVSIGTVMEMAWGFQNQTPVIAIMESEGNPHDHPMVRETIGFRVTTLADAIHMARMILLP